MRLPPWLRVLSILTLVLVLLVVAPATVAQAESAVTLISVSSEGVPATGMSVLGYGRSISADGRFTAFGSYATNLVAGDTNGRPDVFVHDASTGTTRRVSLSSAGVQANGDSASASISADGRYVVFASKATNLAPGITNGRFQIYIHDMAGGTTTCVSVSPEGVQGNDHSGFPSISADGRYVAFGSGATNLLAAGTDTNGIYEVFVRDLLTGTTTRVSVDSAGAQANGYSDNPSISADGRYVAFRSQASNLVAGDTNGVADVFVHDRLTQETTRVSVASAGTEAGGESTYPSISGDGRYVAFQSLAGNLVAADTNAAEDIFVHDRGSGATSRVSVASSGTQSNAGSSYPCISSDGRHVSFRSTATNLVPEAMPAGTSQIYIHDLLWGETRRVSVAPDGSAGNGNTDASAVSADGRYVAFRSWATNLATIGAGSITNVFRSDRGPDPDAIVPLVLGEPTAGRVAPGQSQKYSVEVAEPGAALLIRVTPLEGADLLEVMARSGALPMVGQDGWATRQPTTAGAYEILIDPAIAGTCYVMVHGLDIAGTWGGFEIEASLVMQHLSDVSPRSAGNAGNTTVTVRGAGLDRAVGVALESDSLPAIDGAGMQVASPGELWARFDLTGVPTGDYTLRVTFADGAVLRLVGGFAVVPGTGGGLRTRVITPALARPGRRYTIWVEYANAGDADLPAPLLIVSTEPTMPIKLPDRADWQYGEIMLLGVSHTQPAGVLPPGASERIPLIIETPAVLSNLKVSLEALQAADDPVDWDVYGPVMRPPAYDQGAWDALWPALRTRLGDSWADYLDVLGGAATRLRPRGVDVSDLHQLLALEVMGASGNPVSAVTGGVFDAATGAPLSGVRVVASHQEGAAVRSELSDEGGNFSIAFLPAGVYDVYVEGYLLSLTHTATLTGDTDANGIRLHASPIPPEPDPDPALVLYADPQLLDVEGTPHLVFSRDGYIYHTTYDGAAWAPATQVPGAVGSEPRLLYAPDLLDGADPGLALFWRTGAGNDAAIHYAAARAGGAGEWLWSEAAMYAGHADAGITQPAAVVDANGTPVVVWQMQDFGNLAADTDLYYGHEPVNPLMLTWDEIVGLLILDDPVTLVSGDVLPPGTAVALTGSGEAITLDFAVQEWPASISMGWEFSRHGTVPRFIPYIGGNNDVTFAAMLSGEAGSTEASASGALGGEISMMQKRVTGGVSGEIGAKWVLDPRTCTFNLGSATLSSSISATGRFPIPQLTWEDVVFRTIKTEVGVQVGATLTGELTWRTQGGYWPEGTITGTGSLGFYGKVEFIGGTEGTISGTGNFDVIISADGFNLDQVYFEFATSAQSGSMKFDTSWSYPPSPEALQASGVSLEDAWATALEEMDVSTTLTLQAKPGTTTDYGLPSVRAEGGSDLTDDRSPAMALGSDGKVYLFWLREPEAPSTDLGNTLTYASYNVTAWSAPLALAGTAGFGREPVVARDRQGNMLVAWVWADATGWTLISDPTSLLAAYDQAEVRYGVLRPDGTWVAPVALTSTLSAYHHVNLAAVTSGDIWATWLESTGTGDILYAASWDGSAWSSPQQVATARIHGRATASDLGGQPALIWAQSNDDPALPHSQAAVLFVSTYDGTAWSVPEALPLETPQPGAMVSGALQAEEAGTGGLFQLWITPPPEVCTPVETVPGKPSVFTPPEEPPAPPAPPSKVRTLLGWSQIQEVGARDPNAKLGPLGYDEARWIGGSETLFYTVLFENIESATAPAQQVLITDLLDADLDWTTLRITEIAYGDRVIPVSDGWGGTYVLDEIPDYRPEVSDTWIVESVISLDYATGLLKAVMTTLDPLTGEYPEDPLAGFLPPNDETGRGEGRISFAIDPRPGLPYSTEITNQADIIFDTNAPISTDVWLNTIGWPYAMAVAIEGEGNVLRTPWKDAVFAGELITLTALPDPGWEFVGWSGDASGTTNPLDLTIAGETAVTALFAALPPVTPTVSIAADGDSVALTWPHVPANSRGYEVWWSVDPYFTPGDTGSDHAEVWPTGEEAIHIHPLTGGADAIYFVVLVVNGSGTKSEASARVGVWTFVMLIGEP